MSVVAILSVLARIVAICGVSVVVASAVVLATRDLELVTDAVAVRAV